MPEAIVIVPNYNGSLYLNACFNSLREQTYSDFKTIMVDDCSSDGSVGLVKKNFAEIEILELKKNRGFAKAVNVGIEFALNKYSPKYIALLNNDTRADPNWLEFLVESISGGENIASVASNMFFMDNPNIINSQGGMCNFIGIAKDINYGQNTKNSNPIKKEIISSCFGAALLNASLLPKIGHLDKRYSAYYEDVDWGMRANILGYKIIFDERAIVYHKGSATFKDREYEKVYLCVRNSLCTIIKNYQFRNLLKSAPSLFAYYIKHFIGYLINYKIDNGKIVKISKSRTLKQRIKLAIIPFFAVLWNVKNIRKTMEKRTGIQAMRVFDDEVLIGLMQKRIPVFVKKRLVFGRNYWDKNL